MGSPNSSSPIEQWLDYLTQLHPVEIDMGLERVSAVAHRLNLVEVPATVITVAGTNGKGSTVAMLEAIYLAAGYRVGAYTSPHINVFNERIRLQGENAADQIITAALDAVEQSRLPESLTYFEHTTLAAMQAFVTHGCDLVILEVGLGGRLDATNLWNTNCAIVTSIALDHQSFLGDDRNVIAVEKVAIGRVGVPMIIGELDPPSSMIEFAEKVGMNIIYPNVDKSVENNLRGAHQHRNAACALAAVSELQSSFPVDQALAHKALSSVSVAGRFEQLTIAGVSVVIDVAHNPAAAAVLEQTLSTHFPNHVIHAVFATLSDKDINGVVDALSPMVDRWYCAQLAVARAASSEELKLEVLRVNTDAEVMAYASVGLAWQAAYDQIAQSTDDSTPLILVCGSFFTVSGLHEYLEASHTSVVKKKLNLQSS